MTTSAENNQHQRSSVPPWAVVGIFFVLAVGGMALARAFLMPLVFGFLLALVFSPVRRFLGRRGLPASVAALFIAGSMVLIFVIGLVAVAEPARDWIRNAPAIGQEVERKLRSISEPAQAIVEAGKQVQKLAQGSNEDALEVAVQQPGFVANMALFAPSALAQVVFTLVLLFFLLSSGDIFYEKLVNAMPTFADKKRVIKISQDIERQLSRYLFTITLINAALGIAIGLAMWVLGMPNPILFGVIGFAFNFVPYIGAVAGTVIATVVGIVTFDELSSAALAGGIYFALTAAEGQFVTPYFVGRRLELNTVIIFVAVAFWAWLWSVMGMLLAVPLLVTIRVFCDHIPNLRALGNFIGARSSEFDPQKSPLEPANPSAHPGE